MSLVINNLSKKYDENWIIKDISLEVKKGEILGIFGATGEGKSAFIRTLAGVEDCCGGSIFFDSSEVTRISSEERNFHFPSLTNDSFWKSIFKTQKNSEIADGEGQVLALEDALQRAEHVLLLDNQFCYMDRQTREQMCERLREEVKKKNLAVIFATNDFNEIFSICDRVAVLHKGEIRQIGTPREVYEKPVSTKIASITGRNNLISAKRLASNVSGLPEFQTLRGDHRVFTDRIEGNFTAAATENVTLAIRPEHISISFGASFPEDNLLRAEITNIVFRGATTIISLNAGGLELEALVLRLVGLSVGEECMVGLPPERILILDD